MEAGSKAAEPKDELAVLYPAPRFLSVAGRTVEIKRCGLAQSARLRDIGGPILMREEASGRAFDEWLGDEPAESCSLIVVATGFDADWVAGLNEEDRLELALAVWEANKDFFARRRLGQWARIQRLQMETAAHGTGPTLSSASSPTDTEIPAPTPSSRPMPSSSPSSAPSGAIAAAA